MVGDNEYKDKVTDPVEKDTQIELVARPEREGYIFLGWADEDGKLIWDASKDHYDETVVLATKDEIFYAQWAESCKVTFDANGGVFVEEDGTTLEKFTDEFKKDGYIDIEPWPERKGYMFIGWSKEKENGSIVEFFDDNENPLVKATGDVTYYAQWKEAYFITFDANGGYFKNEEYYKNNKSYPPTYEWYLEPGEMIEPPKDVPVRDGYEFLGWSKEKEGGSIVTFYGADGKTPVYKATEDVTYYAQWSSKADSSGSGSSASSGTKGANTGDENNVRGWIVLLSAAGLSLAALLRNRIKGNTTK